MKNNCFYSVTILILIYLTFDFFKHVKEDFFQSNYDFENAELIYDFKNVKSIDSISYNYLSIDKIDSIPTINSNFTLKLNQENKNYYYRFSTVKYTDSKIIFFSGMWLTILPNLTKEDHMKLSLIDLDIKKEEGKEICMFIDSQFLWKEGRSFRKKLKISCPNINFIGNKRDLHGFNYIGDIIFNFEDLKDITAIPKADYYLIGMGTHDKNFEEIEESIQSFLTRIDNESQVLLINSPIFEKNKERNIKINKILEKIKSNNVKLLDFKKHIEDQKINYMYQDKIHYSKEAIDELVKYLRKEIGC